MGRVFFLVVQLTLLSLCSCALLGRKSQTAGGVEADDPSNPEYLLMAKESIDKFEKSSGNGNIGSNIEVLEAKKQVVAGLITNLVFRVSPQNGQGDTYLCKSKIFEQAWRNVKNIDVSCNIDESKSRQKRQTVGSASEVNPSNPEIAALAQETLKKFKSSTGSKAPLKIVRIDNVTQQVVSGIITKIDYTVSSGNCEGACVALGDVFNVLHKCHAEIWEQAWLNKKEIEVTCDV